MSDPDWRAADFGALTELVCAILGSAHQPLSAASAEPDGIIDLVRDAAPDDLMPSRREMLQRERGRILDLLTRRGARDVRLFGSVARGEDAATSDIDLLVELSEPASAGGELLTVLGLSEELSELLGVRVGVVSTRTLRPEVLELALAEAVPL